MQLNGVLMNPNSSEVLIVYNAHKRDAGTIPHLLSAQGLRYSLIPNHEFVQLRPQLVSKHLIVLGGPQSVAEVADRDALKLLQRIEFYARHGHSVLGICLGAQILARVFGAKVVRHRLGAREIGYHRISQIAPVTNFHLPEGHYYNWHYDVIEEFREARILMRSELSSIQAFSVGNNIFGVQFHPEIDLKTIRLFVKIAAHRLGDFGAQSASDQIAAHQLYAQRNKARLRAALFRWLSQKHQQKAVA
jgi:GMP synthase (glutamine-hydrolysing)